MRTAVVILGYDVLEPNWRETVWGSFPSRAGRLVKGAALMLQEEADLVLITGAGEKEGKQGVEWMRDILYQNLGSLRQFAIYPVFRKFPAFEIKKRLDKALKLEYRPAGETLQNTSRTMKNIKNMLLEDKAGKIVLVSSPDHIARCLRDAYVAWQDYPELTLDLHGTSSITLYSARSADDEAIARISNVVVAEPPVMKKFNLARIFGVLNSPEALSEIDGILKKYGK